MVEERNRHHTMRMQEVKRAEVYKNLQVLLSFTDFTI
jgi:hypothetical protein